MGGIWVFPTVFAEKYWMSHVDVLMFMGSAAGTVSLSDWLPLVLIVKHCSTPVF